MRVASGKAQLPKICPELKVLTEVKGAIIENS